MTITTSRSIHSHPTERVLDEVRELVTVLTAGPTVPTHPVPLAFLDDGRQLFLVIDAVQGRAERIRSWGLEIRTDDDLIGSAQSIHLAIRSTQSPTPEAAAGAARYLLSATAR